jgi:hypothetical protein
MRINELEGGIIHQSFYSTANNMLLLLLELISLVCLSGPEKVSDQLGCRKHALLVLQVVTMSLMAFGLVTYWNSKQ